MTAPVPAADVLHVVDAATLAPSVHNTQPWRFRLVDSGFELYADLTRRLAVLDPDGRQLHLSCGAALLTARVAARALALDAHVDLLPEPADPELLARVHLVPGRAPTSDDVALALALLSRHTVRAPFDPRPLPPALLERLRGAAEQEGAMLRRLRDEDERVELAVLLSAADAAQSADPAYRDELLAWVRPAEGGDGIPPQAVEPVSGRGSSLPLRDFTLRRHTGRSDEPPVAEHPEVVVLTTCGDTPVEWLRAGQALAAVLLHAAADGVQAQPLGQVTDLPGSRQRLAAVLGLVGSVQLVLRIGYADAPALTPRRAVDQVVVQPEATRC